MAEDRAALRSSIRPQNLREHIRQDAAMFEVLDFNRCIDPQPKLYLMF
jgi:hypothetical protein